MKKLMFISNVIFSAILAGCAIFYTIRSLIQVGWQSWHVACVALSLLSILLVKISINELKNEVSK